MNDLSALLDSLLMVPDVLAQTRLLDECSVDGISFRDQNNCARAVQILSKLLNEPLKEKFLAKMSDIQIKDLCRTPAIFRCIQNSPGSLTRFISMLDATDISFWPLISNVFAYALFLNSLDIDLSAQIFAKMTWPTCDKLIRDLDDLGYFLGILNSHKLRLIVTEHLLENISLQQVPLAKKPLVMQHFVSALLTVPAQLRSILLSGLGMRRCNELLGISYKEGHTQLTHALLSYMVPASWTIEQWMYSSLRMLRKPTALEDSDPEFSEEEIYTMKVTNRSSRKQHEFFRQLDEPESTSELCSASFQVT